eukprot:14188-Pelagococcus_subviridis.AAC.1
MDPRPRVRVPRRRRRRRGEKKTRRDAAPRAPRRLQQRRGERARGREGDARGTVDVESVAQRGRARRGGGGVSVFFFFAPPRLRLRRDAGVLATPRAAAWAALRAPAGVRGARAAIDRRISLVTAPAALPRHLHF